MQAAMIDTNNPAALCAVVATRTEPKRKRASYGAHPTITPPASVPIPDSAKAEAQPINAPPHQEPHPTVDSLPAYTPVNPAIIADIVDAHRRRQAVIRAKTKLQLQALAVLRSLLCSDLDFEDDAARADGTTAFGTKRRKLTSAALKRVDAAMAEAKSDPTSDYHVMLYPYLASQKLFDEQQLMLEKDMVRAAKQLPVYQWVKSVKGFGDVSFATIVGECGDIGSYKSIAAVWKRLGLAVINGKRQGAPGAGASAEDWIGHGYSGQRRSVSWNARQQVIGGMGKWRPEFGEDIEASNSLTEWQKVYAARARYEAQKLGSPVKRSDKGKESYTMHVANRAHRYVEKRLIKYLYLNWRHAA